MLRLLGGIIRDPILDLGPYSSSTSSSSKLEALLDPRLPSELISDGILFLFPSNLSHSMTDLLFVFASMLKKISLKKLVKIAQESKGVSLTARLTPAVKRIKIGEKRL